MHNVNLENVFYRIKFYRTHLALPPTLLQFGRLLILKIENVIKIVDSATLGRFNH